jgi:intron-binding protein aquarius
MGLEMPPAMAQTLETRPTVSDLHEDNHWVNLAKTYWLKQGKVRKAKHDVIKKEIWDPLEAEGFSLRSLLTLENLNVLEK